MTLVKGIGMFTNAYCPDSLCTPTRLALMTGTFYWRNRKTFGVLGNWERSAIPAGTATVPGIAQKAGYHTIGIGKWHLGCTWTTSDGAKPIGLKDFNGTGDNVRIDVPISDGPRAHGFSEWYGFICASEQLVVQDDRVAALLTMSTRTPPKMPGVDKLPQLNTADYLVDVFDRAIAAMHTPRDKPWLMYVAPYFPNIPLTPPAEFIGKSQAGAYGDYILALDHHIGRLLTALGTSGAAENTLVLFASDNGAVAQDLQPVELVKNGHFPNGKLRGGKNSIYEGGVRTPLLVRWPKKISPGSVDDGIVVLTDVLATVAQITGSKIQEAGRTDSISFLPRLLGQSHDHVRREVVMKGQDFAIRIDQWKLIVKKVGNELYDLSADLAEKIMSPNKILT